MAKSSWSRVCFWGASIDQKIPDRGPRVVFDFYIACVAEGGRSATFAVVDISPDYLDRTIIPADIQTDRQVGSKA